MAFVKCPCAFRLRRLAQNSGPEISVRQFPCKFPDKMALVKCPCAFAIRALKEILETSFGNLVQRAGDPHGNVVESLGLLLLCNAEFMGRFPGRTAAIGIYVASKVHYGNAVNVYDLVVHKRIISNM